MTVEWTPSHKEITSRNICSRTRFPIRFAHAWSPWKAQEGSTIKCKFSLHLGDSELEHRLTYVAFSRAKNVSDILLLQGITNERLTTQIKRFKKLIARIEEEKRLECSVYF